MGVTIEGMALAPAGVVSSPGPTIVAERRYVEGVLGHAMNASPFGARSPNTTGGRVQALSATAQTTDAKRPMATSIARRSRGRCDDAPRRTA